ncbi:uncharacterized protein C8Q71DRAFT_738022 [Rhodofomes roseus]|uniref:AN1-type domain-containing protein n=1 Tax=Rhodofomes roseus TaxID=34475 RepID=A0ABQ8KS53_9APHY|nr:uncharacterized protein C8Q71DRAFT_738022 [Rhodofomes roseus]KAH9841641.1 hypothetical protein C8Q71DRAFT_738022 [Rhodofomes roseus]
MSGTSTPERETGLLGIGQQCSAPSCMLVDFLPYKCQHCSHPFCGEHFHPEAHKCDKFDASKHNRVAPPCPFCNTPVAIPPGQDPNIRMEEHITSECSVMTGKTRKSSHPTCARAKCGKVLYAPIRCDKCKQQFCPQHRFPTSHTCSASASAKSASSSASPFQSASSQASAAGAAAIAAIQHAMASTNISNSSTTTLRSTTTQTRRAPQPPVMGQSASSASTRSSTRSNPFSQTDRRARAERESRRQAIATRAKKGLPLTEEEKAILAEGSVKEDCVIM